MRSLPPPTVDVAGCVGTLVRLFTLDMLHSVTARPAELSGLVAPFLLRCLAERPADNRWLDRNGFQQLLQDDASPSGGAPLELPEPTLLEAFEATVQRLVAASLVIPSVNSDLSKGDRLGYFFAAIELMLHVKAAVHHEGQRSRDSWIGIWLSSRRGHQHAHCTSQKADPAGPD
eukprot:SAG31_NODE_1543_length_7944_cov_8.711281_9_plen_174_part_00